MSFQVELLEESFTAIASQREKLADVFYKNLFQDYPEIETLFEETDMTEQRSRLMSSLRLIVGNLTHTEVLEPALEYLGRSHFEHGVRQEHYPAVGHTLLRSLREVTGAIWTEEHHCAWEEAYVLISKTMLAGAAEAAEAV